MTRRILMSKKGEFSLGQKRLSSRSLAVKELGSFFKRVDGHIEESTKNDEVVISNKALQRTR